MQAMAGADVGIAFTSEHPRNFNHSMAAGASNKPFEYLACGLALLCTNGAQWQQDFVEPYGYAADPKSAESIAQALQRMHADRTELRARGERGRQRVLSEWHIEHAATELLRVLERSP
jgi:glycosyltransferase involved in cell wall biosynthesis